MCRTSASSVGRRPLEGLYRTATQFVFSSRCEGFGLPVLAAMARGLAVACGNARPVVEVAGDAALILNHERPDQMAAAMQALLADRDLRGRLVEPGRGRAAELSPDTGA